MEQVGHAGPELRGLPASRQSAWCMCHASEAVCAMSYARQGVCAISYAR
jgi:hypothetical protein